MRPFIPLSSAAQVAERLRMGILRGLLGICFLREAPETGVGRTGGGEKKGDTDYLRVGTLRPSFW